MATLFSDTFTDTNGTLLSSHTPDTGGSWTAHPVNTSPTGTIENNRVYGGDNDSWWYTPALGFDDYRVSAKSIRVDFITTDTIGNFIYARMSTSTNSAYYVRKTSGSGGAIILGRLISGSNTVFSTKTGVGDEDGVMQLEVEGTSIRGYWQKTSTGEWYNGTSFQASRTHFHEQTDSTHTTGRAGINPSNSSAGARTNIDDFEVETLTIVEVTKSETSTISFVDTNSAKIYRRPLYFNGTRIAALPSGEYVSGIEPNAFFTQAISDIDSATYYYYGGYDSTGEWKINRYLKTDLNSKTSANEAGNGAYTELSSAWAARASLVYG